MAQGRLGRALLALSLVAGCGTATAVRAADVVELTGDVAAATDAPDLLDAGRPSDTVTAPADEGAAAADVAKESDVGSEADAAVTPDVGSEVDAAEKPDVGSEADAAVTLDVGSEADVAEKPDVASAVDVTPPRDVAREDAPRGPERAPDVVVLPDVVTVRDATVADAPRADVVAAPDAARGDAGLPMDAGPRADVVDVVDVGTPDAGPALPPWDPATVAHVREVRARGVAQGNRVGVFAKIGDSITESGSFMADIGWGWFDLGAYQHLDPTIRYFRATSLGDADTNAFNRPSACATAGWTADDALAGGTNSPLRQELAATRPAWAIVMYGTNDIDRSDLGTYRANLLRIVDVIEAAGTVPAVSTIPDRGDGAGPAARALQFNAVVREVAASRHLPLIDYWLALQTLPARGLSPDGIHPSVYIHNGSTASADFTPAGLRYGYNVRNLTALQMLDRLRALP